MSRQFLSCSCASLARVHKPIESWEALPQGQPARTQAQMTDACLTCCRTCAEARQRISACIIRS